MIQIALALRDIPDKTIVRTGSMQPARFHVTTPRSISARPSPPFRRCRREFTLR
jgi:hypothetical protein